MCSIAKQEQSAFFRKQFVFAARCVSVSGLPTPKLSGPNPSLPRPTLSTGGSGGASEPFPFLLSADTVGFSLASERLVGSLRNDECSQRKANINPDQKNTSSTPPYTHDFMRRRNRRRGKDDRVHRSAATRRRAARSTHLSYEPMPKSKSVPWSTTTMSSTST